MPLATPYNIVVGGQTLLGRRPFEWGLLNGGGKEEGEGKTYFAQLGPLEWKAAGTSGNKSCAMIFKREGIVALISFM